MTENQIVIKPTGKCFDDALDFICSELKRNPNVAIHLRLCHGICVGTDNQRYSHAWVEDGCPEHPENAGVWFAGIINDLKTYCYVNAKEYYDHHRVIEITRYSLPEAWEENKKSGHYGPWVEKYRKLCKPRTLEAVKL